MKKYLLSILILLISIASRGQNATDLFISEYIEGSSNNKYIEIFNGTGGSVDLSDYQLLLFTNGSATANYTNALTGSLANGSAMVFRNTSATIYSGTSTIATTTNFNGDDAIALRKISSSTYVDIIGRIGEDPGTEWVSGSHSTLNKTLVRKSNVTAGITVNPTSGFPTLEAEWDVLAIDDISNLGSHTFAPVGPSDKLHLTNPTVGQSYQSGQSVTFQWTATDILKIKFQMQMQGSTVWTDIEDLLNIDATLGQLSYTIPTDVTGGQMQMRIVDQSNATVFSAPSGFFTLVDVHFAGLSANELLPVNNQEDVPTDLIYGYLKLVFNEDVAWGQGNIYLRKGSDNSIVRTFNASSGNAGYAADSKRILLLQTEHELLANTQYYVTIEANAIVDLATVPNAYSGFTANSVWNFTTGSTNSIVPIETIQTPVDATDISPKNNQKVKAKGTVMYRNNSGYFIQEGTGPFMGIYVYHVGNTVEAGDLVEVYGTIKEYSSFTEFDPVEFTRVVSKGNPLYEAVDISAGFSEQYESMLVKLSGVKVSSTGFITAKEFTVSDAAETTTWTIDDWLYGLGSAPTQGAGYESITGFLNGYAGYKLAPSKAADLVQVPTAIDETEVSSTTITYLDGTIVVESAVAVESVSVTSISGTTTSTSMNASAATEGEKGKEIVIPVRKSGSVTDEVSTVSLGSHTNATASIKLQRKLSPGIYVVKVVLANKTVLTSKVLVR